MENIKNVCKGIEKVLMCIYSEGINEIDEALVVGELEELIVKANELKMRTGETLLKEFILKYREYKDGETEIKKMAKILMAVDLYTKNIVNYGDVSEL
jgi:hypothetical protein